ncbi:hypothetical protein ACFWZU_07875 [Frateuria sp. GZRR33]|uniref:hypothetical protein n=1 Tax=Frateuria sp. GZRR33 TaxID=3351535 RepID=UPI003EDCA8EB
MHQWFVHHVQGGSDDCRPAFVDKESLGALQALCERATETPWPAPEPTNPFGVGYLDAQEVRYTLEILGHAINMTDQGWDIYYRASW